jgi:protein-S-isoprenylcysteine O-methyltransferase Ste14
MSANFILGLCMCLTGLTVRTTYEFLKKAGRVDERNTVLFAGVFVAMFLMLSSWPLMCPADPTRVEFPAIVHIIGRGLWIIGAGLAVVALLQLRGVENIDHLVTTGLFARLRHPMYLGFIFWIAGWGLYAGAIVSLLAGLAAIGNVLLWQHWEEAKLIADYGTQYLEYRRRTWL